MNSNQLKIDLQEEIWADVVGAEGHYIVSNMGLIKSVDRYVDTPNNTGTTKRKFQKGGVMKPFLAGNGYLRIHLRNSSSGKKFPVHRLVAQAFISNPNNLPFINHKNGVKTDNRACNIEWCDASYNSKHALMTGLMSMDHLDRTGKLPYNAKIILDTSTGIYYESETAAAKARNMNRQNLNEMLRGTNGKHNRINKSPFIYA